MITTHRELWLCCLTSDQRSNTCGYWYCVLTNMTQSHAAFRTAAALRRWASDRGLTLPELPPLGQHMSAKIGGEYRVHMHYPDRLAFDALDGMTTRELSNAQWTAAKITQDTGSVRTVHYLNPNVPCRDVFDYKESEALHNAGLF